METVQEQVAFGTNEAGALAGGAAPVDPTYFHSDVSSDLSGFLSRPVKIMEESWVKDTPLAIQIDPWTLFMTTPTVKQKLIGFGAIRANLRVKFAISGSPFFSGYALVSYNPMPDFDLQRNLPVNVQYAPIRESQRISTTLDPTLSKGGEIMCPYYWPYDGLGMLTSPEFSYMGVITIRDLARLRSVSDTSTSCTITAYAWLEDVSFIGQTSQTVAVPTVAHMAEADKPGPVSKVATAISDKAGMLKAVPGIGSYAAATEVAAKGIATAAKAFGYSRPSDQSDIVKVTAFNDVPMAPTNQAIPEYVLATDVRNELTIDPRVAGFPNVDELDIDHLVGRESFLCSGTLQLSDTPGSILFSSGVTPLLFSEDTGNRCEHHTPMSYVAGLFSKWRGNINFRFVFHTSAFHKAKVRVVHDCSETFTGSFLNRTNMAEHYIADISEEREFTIRVGWSRHEQFLRVDGIERSERWSTNALHTSSPTHELNGNIVMVLENAMTAPYNLDPSDAEVQFSVFVSADNMHLACPTESFSQTLKFTPDDPTPPVTQSTLGTKKKKGGPKSTIAHSKVDPTSVSAPEESLTPTYTFGEAVDSSGPQAIIFIGERVQSLRALLKRFCSYTYVHHTPPLKPQYHKIWHRNYPIPRGVTDDIYPWRAMTYVNYIGQMFLARRGGLRWQFQCKNDLPVVVEAINPLDSISLSALWDVPGSDYLISEMYLKIVDNGMGGQQMFRRTGSVMVPGSSRERFLPARYDLQFSAGSETGFSVVLNAAPEDPASMMVYVAGAEDLTYHGFVGTPLVFHGDRI